MPAIYRRRRSVRRGEGEGKHGAGGVERKKAAPASFGDWLGMSVWRRKRRGARWQWRGEEDDGAGSPFLAATEASWRRRAEEEHGTATVAAQAVGGALLWRTATTAGPRV